MNKNITVLLLMISALMFGAPAVADFEKGLDAYDREDFATALKEWKILAEEGDPSSQYNLGVMYLQGTGVKEDIVAARTWLNIAMKNGFPHGEKMKAALDDAMTPAQLEKAEKLAAQWQPVPLAQLQ